MLRQHRHRRLRQGPTSHRIITHLVNHLATAATFATAGVARDLLLQAPSQLPRSATCSCVRTARSSVRASARAARRPQPQKRHANSTAAHRHANSTDTQQHHHHDQYLKAQPPPCQRHPPRANTGTGAIKTTVPNNAETTIPAPCQEHRHATITPPWPPPNNTTIAITTPPTTHRHSQQRREDNTAANAVLQHQRHASSTAD